MNIVNISKSEFKKLKKFVLEKSILNTEAELYFVKEKEKWKTNVKLLKLLFHSEGNIFSNKLFTINQLLDNKDNINIPELIFPEKMAIVDEKIVGFTMPFIDNVNFLVVLNDKNIPNSQKIEYFKQIGIILNKMKSVRNNTSLNDFFLNDLHEANFILNKKTNKINAVDLDSCKINGNKPFMAKYLTPISQINNLNKKYNINQETNFSGYIIPDENTDLYCYIVMLLNFLYKDRITTLSIEKYFLYLEYLKSLGLPYEFIDKLAKVYEYAPNENIMEYLDLLNDDIIFKSQKILFDTKMKKH